jgi:anaerobic magnesium-protoporphyrin IX monomethyl ester cyclase
VEETVVLCALNTKYVHVSPAPWCLAAGVKAYAPELYGRIRIIEAHINQPTAEVLEQIVAARPAVAGFSCYIWNIDATLDLCRELKRALPDVVIVLGGPEVSYCAKDVLQNNEEIDYILAGEGEESFPAFLRTLFGCGNPNPIPEEARHAVAGLCGRSPDGTIYESSPCVLDGITPSPLSAGYAQAIRGRIAYFETSRGCPYSCAFCLSGGCGKPRFFELNGLFDGLLRLANSGVKTIKFVDRTFNANAAHANRILRFILEHYGKDIPAGVCFHFEIAGDILREETFGLLEQMPPGAVQLEIGIQSFCEKALEAVNRKTNIALLQSNIRRLVDMGNMHIHIDLIAGLPYETLEIFAESFNKAYALGAHMLQLGFLKLLHGSAMRSQPQNYPCEFDEKAPYEVRCTPWISAEDLRLLHHTENALERVYNSGRFRQTAEYVLKASGKAPFEFYTGLGAASRNAGLDSGISLDDYTAFFQEYCAALPGVDMETLRDNLVRDRLATNSTGGLPPCLRRDDELLARAVKRLSQAPETSPKKGVRRGVALLYGAKAVCWADYDPAKRNPVTGRWKLNEIPMDKILKKF